MGARPIFTVLPELRLHEKEGKKGEEKKKRGGEENWPSGKHFFSFFLSSYENKGRREGEKEEKTQKGGQAYELEQDIVVARPRRAL